MQWHRLLVKPLTALALSPPACERLCLHLCPCFSLTAAFKASLRIAGPLCSIITGHQEDNPFSALASNSHLSVSLKSILNSTL